MALENERNVLVDGSKKRVLRILLWRQSDVLSPLAKGIILSLQSSMYSISFFEKSLIDTTSRPLKSIGSTLREMDKGGFNLDALSGRSSMFEWRPIKDLLEDIIIK